MPSDATVIAASVVSGAMSEIAPTNVVLPTPKPPATTILTGTGERPGVRVGSCDGTRDGSWDGGLEGSSEGTDTFDQTGDQVDVVGHAEAREVGLEEPVDDEVGRDHADHTDRQVQASRELGDR